LHAGTPTWECKDCFENEDKKKEQSKGCSKRLLGRQNLHLTWGGVYPEDVSGSFNEVYTSMSCFADAISFFLCFCHFASVRPDSSSPPRVCVCVYSVLFLSTQSEILGRN